MLNALRKKNSLSIIQLMKKKLRYKALILDHDDTVVDSTASIHYPAYLEILGKLRPEHQTLSLEQWFEKNFIPEGIMDFFVNDLGLNQQELDLEYRLWLDYTAQRAAPFFPKMAAFLREYEKAGGILAVISLSDKERIIRDYKTAGLKPPDVIFGWDINKNRRKPAPWPAEQVLKKIKLPNTDVLMIDDALSGQIMAKNCGIPFAASAWAHNIKSIHTKMQESSDFFFKNANDFQKFIFFAD